MKLVGLSGAQGAGKSTLLKALMEKGWRLDEYRVSRAVQAALGWDSLDRVMESPQTMIQFQEEVFKQKYNHDFALTTMPSNDLNLPIQERKNILLSMDSSFGKNPEIMLTERTFADIDAYTSQWVWRFVDQDRMTTYEAMSFLTKFHAKCLRAHIQCYSGTILLPFMKHVAWEDDPNRAAKNDVETVYEHIRRYMEMPQFLAHPKLVIKGKSVDDRVGETERFLESI